MRRSAERSQTADDDRHLVQGPRRPLGHVASEPPQRVALAAVAVVKRDQRGEAGYFSM